MEYIIYLPLIVFAFFIMFMWIQGLESHIDKHKSLIQNLESSIDTQKLLTKILSAELWKLKNPPQYKIGDKINYPQNPEQDVMITDVKYVDSEPYTNHFLKNCSTTTGGRWSYTAINLKTGERAFL